ncbi:MAG: hypothetical protein ACXACE_06240 [Candidatus Thorarchaeota archaeon]|jgi:DNA-directed RNA polymerase subunit RPC12/RpoP
MKEHHHKSPWAYDDTDVKCPRCGNKRVYKVLSFWSFSRGVQTFECTTCGKKFYDRGYDDYEPTFKT